ncbi:MAG: antirepressor regulating drug resistance protein, partial [Lachnospiraceae bacterium]|nr:antirepressor regulating drug resistance protein [Lachnospiraceae bacterium]
MEQMLIRVLNMSLTAGIVILAVMSARLMLRRAPKIFSYVLWLAVLFRLLCPLSFSLDFSLLGMLKAPLPQQGQMQYIPENIGLMRRPEISLPGDIVTDIVNSSLPAGTPEASMNPMQGILFAGAVIWLAGVLTMIVYSMVSYGK